MQAVLANENGWTEEDAGKVGVWLFLLSEILLFGALLASYLSTRLGNPDCALGVTAWPEAGHGAAVALAALNTVILLTSSYTMVRSIGRAGRGDRAGFRKNLLATVLLGGAFLVVKSVEYTGKVHHGLYPGSELALANQGLSIFLSYYYGMTILHMVHVVVGMAWNGTLLFASSSAAMPSLARKSEFAGLYWHFVDVVWVFLFPLLYLI